MQVPELFALTLWIDKEIRESEIPSRYQNLQQVLAVNAQPNQKQPFESEQEALFEALRAVPLEQLTQDQLSFLDCLGVLEHVGESAVAALEDVLFRKALDVATAASRLTEAMSSVERGVAKSDAIQSALEGCVEAVEKSDVDVLVRVSFAGEATIGNVVELKKWSSKWHEIARGIAMAHDEPPESVLVVGAGTGSIVVELAVGYGVARTVGTVLHEALKVAERVMNIRLKAEELRGMKLSNNSIVKELEAEAKKEKVSGAETITTSVLVKLDISLEGEGDKATALRKSVDGLLEFLDKGGHVDCVLPELKDESEEAGADEDLRTQVAELRESFEQIRLLESSLKRLGPGPGDGGGA